MKKLLFLPLFAFSLAGSAQVFIGSGYANASFYGPSAFDEGSGLTFQVEKDFNLSASTRLKMSPNINISFLYSKIDRVVFPTYLNVISFSPKVSYEIVSKERFKIAPYANPFVSYFLGLHSGDFFVKDEPIINRYKWGVELGLRIDIMIGKVPIRLIPLSEQISIGDIYRQWTISAMVGI